MKKTYLLLILMAVLLSACESKRIPKDAVRVEPINATKSSGNSYSVADFSLEIPSDWVEEKASNNMRVAEFKLKDFSEYSVVVSYFGNSDNMIEANISRWRGQFTSEDSYTELELANKNLAAIKILGTYKLKAFPMAQDFTETPNYGTLAAILPSSEGPYFLKLTAPEGIIQNQEKIFIQVLNSYKK